MNSPRQQQLYAHFYINGLYWGVYHVFERFDASFLAEHFGGEEEDWDAFKDTPTAGSVTAGESFVVGGEDIQFREMHDLAKSADMTDPDIYNRMLELVDVPNLADYLLTNYYSSNQDWDHKNIRYGRLRAPSDDQVGAGFLYFAWDAERHGLNGLSDRSLNSNVTNKNTTLGPSALNRAMHANPDYHLRFQDRVVKHLYRDGALSPVGAARSWNALAEYVKPALIAESTRWGDLHTSKPETTDGNWTEQLAKENEIWFPARTDILLDQLSRQGFIESKPIFPNFTPFGGIVEPGHEVRITGFNVTIFSPLKGAFYYTQDGSDPRMPDGSLNPNAQLYDQADPPTITQASHFHSRVFDDSGGDWSPLSEAYFHLAAVATPETLVISELHFHPAPPSESEIAAGFDSRSDFEFLELQNVSEVPLDLSGLQITSGIRSRVEPSPDAIVNPGQWGLIVANRQAFQARYPGVSSAEILADFEGGARLSNGGERLSLYDHDTRLIHTFRFDNKAPWPEDTGEGKSYEYIGEAGPSPAHPGNWESSEAIGGTPAGVLPSAPPVTTVVSLTEWLTTRGLTTADPSVLLHYAFGVDTFPSSPETFHLQVEDSSISFPRRQGATGIVWTIEHSSNLTDWTTTPDTALTVSERDATTETARFSFSPDLSQTYWRLKISTN